MSFSRSIRSDFWEHPKTRGLSLLARDIHWQGVCANLLGLLQLSQRQIARRSGATPGDVSAAVEELESRGIAKWWQAFEVLWIREALDENAKNEAAKIAAKRAVDAFPSEVILEIGERYPWIRSGPCEAEDRVFSQKKETDPDPGGGEGGRARPHPTIRIIGKTPDPLLDAINSALGVTITSDQHGRFYTSAAERVADGATVDEIEVALRAWAADDRAKRPDRRKLFYAKQWQWTRERYLEAPKAPTEPAAEANHQRPPPTPEERAQLNNLLAQATKKYGRGGRNE